MLCKWQIFIKANTNIAGRINRWDYDIVGQMNGRIIEFNIFIAVDQRWEAQF